MALIADLAHISPAGQTTAKALPGLPRSDAAFSALLGQIALTRGVQPLGAQATSRTTLATALPSPTAALYAAPVVPRIPAVQTPAPAPVGAPGITLPAPSAVIVESTPLADGEPAVAAPDAGVRIVPQPRPLIAPVLSAASVPAAVAVALQPSHKILLAAATGLAAGLPWPSQPLSAGSPRGAAAPLSTAAAPALMPRAGLLSAGHPAPAGQAAPATVKAATVSVASAIARAESVSRLSRPVVSSPVPHPAITPARAATSTGTVQPELDATSGMPTATVSAAQPSTGLDTPGPTTLRRSGVPQTLATPISARPGHTPHFAPAHAAATASAPPSPAMPPAASVRAAAAPIATAAPPSVRPASSAAPVATTHPVATPPIAPARQAAVAISRPAPLAAPAVATSGAVSMPAAAAAPGTVFAAAQPMSAPTHARPAQPALSIADTDRGLARTASTARSAASPTHAMPVGGGETPPASPATPATVRAVSPAPLRQTAAAGATIAPAAAALTALPLPPDPKAAAALSAGQTSATASPPAGTLTPAAAGARTAKNPEMASTANTAPAPVVAPLTDTPAAMTPMAGSQPLSDPGLLAAIATPPRIAAAPAAKTDTTHDDTIAPDSAAASAFSPQTPQAVAAIAAGGRATPVQPHLSDKDSAAPHTTGTTAIASTGPSAGTSPATATPASAPATPSTGQSNATPPPTPAAQLASAVASLHVGADGTSHTTIKLDPAELGSVQIRISRATDGTASVSISVERPDTLATLQNDLGHLHQALDRAGLPDQRSVTLHLATQPDQSSATTLGTGTGTAFSQQGGFQQGGRQHAHTAGQSPPTAGTPPDATPAIVPSRATAGAGSGINITA